MAVLRGNTWPEELHSAVVAPIVAPKGQHALQTSDANSAVLAFS